eukprot:sb/3462978/
MLDANVSCQELDSYPTFQDAFLSCPSIIYLIFTALNSVLAVGQLLLLLYLLFGALPDTGREIPYLASLAPFSSIVSVIELYNPSTTELLSSFRFLYLVFCILQFYQHLTSFYGQWHDLLSLLPGFTYEATICCWCCKVNRYVTLTRRRLLFNKTLVYTGVITYLIAIMITASFDIPDAAENTILGVGVVLFVVGIRAIKRLISVTRQFYPSVGQRIKKRWVAVRLVFVVVGLQSFLLRLLRLMGLIPPAGLFNSDTMVDLIHNMVVPAELTYASLLAYQAFRSRPGEQEEMLSLLPSKRWNNSSQTEFYQAAPPRVDSGVDSPTDRPWIPGYGALSQEMMDHVDITVIELYNPSTTELLSSFRFLYLVFCILQFYQHLTSFYGQWHDLLSLLPGFTYEATICCWCCKVNRYVTLTRRRLLFNKTLVYTGVITYLIAIMITASFDIPDAAENTILGVGVVLFVVGIRAIKRLISVTRQFYPSVGQRIKKRWVAVRLVFVVVGLQSFLLRLLRLMGLIPPAGLFNSDTMVDLIHNMVVPAELTYASLLAYQAFRSRPGEQEEMLSLLPSKRWNNSSQTEFYQAAPPRVDSGVDSPTDRPWIPGYGALSQEMMDHVDITLEMGLDRFTPGQPRTI